MGRLCLLSAIALLAVFHTAPAGSFSFCFSGGSGSSNRAGHYGFLPPPLPVYTGFTPLPYNQYRYSRSDGAGEPYSRVLTHKLPDAVAPVVNPAIPIRNQHIFGAGSAVQVPIDAQTPLQR